MAGAYNTNTILATLKTELESLDVETLWFRLRHSEVEALISTMVELKIVKSMSSLKHCVRS
jgi:hypothetical protein